MAKIVIQLTDKLGASMAGPAIRYWEMAKELSKKHQVILLSRYETSLTHPDFEVLFLNKANKIKALTDADIFLFQTISASNAWLAKSLGVKLIYDAYDPLPLEVLEIFKDHPPLARNAHSKSVLGELTFAFEVADAYLCANERQRDLWIGFLMALGKLTPAVYDQNSLLEHLLALVPFGLPTSPPKKDPSFNLRKKLGLKPDAKILLWGGGIWNWFDPLTLIRAIHAISKKRSDVHLVFMGIKHPNEDVPEMRVAKEAVELAQDLDLIDRHVFFNYGWVPYEERQNYLLDADIGVSTHEFHLETEFSFRTRILDYLWASLPMVVTKGDYFAELIHNEKLGHVVEAKDVEGLTYAIEEILNHPQQIAEMKERIKVVAENFQWSRCIARLDQLIDRQLVSSNSLFPKKLIVREFLTSQAKVKAKAMIKPFIPKAVIRQIRQLQGRS